jgi:ribulose-phosphate 3-epimerase
MSIITPTITTSEPHIYREQMEKIAEYTDGVHLDFSDGIFAPTTLLPIEDAWRSDDLISHAHIMYQKPGEVLEEIMHLEADLVILHAESDDVKKCLKKLQANGTRTGIALLPETSLSDLEELGIDDLFDHILVFGGRLGYQGSEADLDQLLKVKQLREAYPDVEIAWDGGVNEDNAKQISDAGVDILNVGGYLKNSHDAKKTYRTLSTLVS